MCQQLNERFDEATENLQGNGNVLESRLLSSWKTSGISFFFYELTTRINATIIWQPVSQISWSVIRD